MGRVKHPCEVEGDNSIELAQSRKRSVLGMGVDVTVTRSNSYSVSQILFLASNSDIMFGLFFTSTGSYNWKIKQNHEICLSLEFFHVLEICLVEQFEKYSKYNKCFQSRQITESRKQSLWKQNKSPTTFGPPFLHNRAFSTWFIALSFSLSLLGFLSLM